MVDSVTLGSLRRLTMPTFQNIALAASKSGNLSLFYESVTDNITAFAGGGQTNATALTTEINRITTAANSGDSIKLPSTSQVPSSGPGYAAGSVVPGPGATIFIINHGANPIQVFGSGTDTINDVASGTGVSQMANSVVLYTCTSAGKWYTEGLATGYGGAGALQTFSFLAAVSGSSGSTLGTAQTLSWASSAQLTSMINRASTVSTVVDSATGFSLPPTTSSALPGTNITFINNTTASVNVFSGNTLDFINAQSSSVGFAVGSSKSAEFFSVAANHWHTILGA